MKTLFNEIAKQNCWINSHGQIPESRSGKGFLNDWHNLTNEQVLEIVDSTRDLAQQMGWHISKQLEQRMDEIVKYTLDHVVLKGFQGVPNVVNPTEAVTRRITKMYGSNEVKLPSGIGVKRAFFQMMRWIAEFYNDQMKIDLDNKDSSQGTFADDWDGLDPLWTSPSPKDLLFEF